MTPKKPPKLTLTSLSLLTAERLTAQFNPTQLDIAIKAVYNKVVIPGNSHELMQFSHTTNLSLKFDLFFNVTNPSRSVKTEAEKQAGNRAFVANTAFAYPSAVEKFTVDDRRAAEAFLLAHVTPQAATRGIRLAAPSGLLVVWPNYLSFEAALTDLSFKPTRFNSSGQPVDLTVSVQMEELRDVRFTADDVIFQDFDRAGKAYIPGA
jgi:hypothetical protein